MTSSLEWFDAFFLKRQRTITRFGEQCGQGPRAVQYCAKVENMSATGPLCAPASGLRRREQRHYPKLRDAAGLIRSRDRARGEGAAER
jgi:hypothetical protein